MSEPGLIIDFGAITAAALVYFIIGWLWYGPLFGKIWMNEAGIQPESLSLKVKFRAITLTLAGVFLTSFVLTHAIQVWRPSAWGFSNTYDDPNYSYGILAAGFTWIGYYVPVLLSSVVCENRSWKFFFINAGYHLTGLMVAAQILSFWK